MSHPEDPSVSLGGPLAWSRDLALVGAATALALGVVTPLAWPTVAVTAILATLGGAALGALVPRLLHRRVRAKPWLLLAFAAVGLGACWGGGAGLVAAHVTGGPWVRATELAATATAAQLGWLWLPLVIRRAHRRSTRAHVLAACAAAPLAGWLAHLHVTW